MREGGGAGGSSFVSGLKGCKAIDKNGSPTDSPYHFSGLSFLLGKMLAGDEEMPASNSNDLFATTIGNKGNGSVRISFLHNVYTCMNKKRNAICQALSLIVFLC